MLPFLDSRRARRIRPLTDFLSAEAAGGAVLLAATLVAIVWANSPWKDSYVELWSTDLTVRLGSRALALDLRDWVNDALMTVFFLVAGLEIKRELVQGELREPRRAALPAIAALGGMVVPAALYVAVARGGDQSAGWGIPMATDIAMAIGVVALLGSRVAPALKLFLLALAIVDDIGAIVVIAVFYAGAIDSTMLLLASALVGVVIGMRAVGVAWTPAYVAVGAALWLATHEAGVHATLTGVVLGLLAPTSPRLDPRFVDEAELVDVSTVRAARATVVQARASVSVVEWLEHLLHPWSSLVIVPVFALANAGISIDADAVRDVAGSRVAWGVVLGLVVGKPLGITVASWLAIRLGAGELPTGATWRALVGVACVAGIGFTVSLFVSDLAFDAAAFSEEAKLAVLGASLVSAIVGSSVLRSCSRR